ncbi:MAG: glycosyltransferase family 2 protein [Phycisphaeraceae bacterium]|nr:glycosyltransferase family 2 protein [Phycisphaeraceae bacterium]
MNFPITVIIPCHNAGPWLASTLASVAAQTHKPDAVILVADRCSDDSVKIAKDFPLVIDIIETDFGNAGPARNSGIHAATTQWVALLDADDHWLPGHLLNASRVLLDTEHVAYCAGHHFMDNDDNVLPLPPNYWQGWPEVHTHLNSDDYVQLMDQRMHFGHSTVIYNRKRLLEVGCFDPAQLRRHDLDLWLRMIHQHTWAYHPGPAAAYRNQTPGSISSKTVEVAYYALRALARNQQAMNHRTYDSIVAGYAQRAMSVAFNDADTTWAKKLRELAMPHLTGKYKFCYTMMGIRPPVFKMLIGLKRATLGRLLTLLKHRRERKAAQRWHSQESE